MLCEVLVVVGVSVSGCRSEFLSSPSISKNG